MQIYAISFGVYGIVSIFTLMIYGALPVMAAKNGLSPQQIGLLYLTMIPFMLSFFCSGFVESYRKKHSRNLKLLCLALGAVSILGFVLVGVACTPSNILLMSVVFVGLVCDMWLWQNHAFIVLGLGGVSVYFCALSVFAYSLGMRWCEDSTQSGVDFGFLRSAENACFVIGGAVASQILGIFITQDKLDVLSRHSSSFGALYEVLEKSGIERSVANGYGMLFCASLLFAIIALGIVVRNKKLLK